jgi:CDP-glucose 4,6-dehydratase
MGADVHAFALPPSTVPAHATLLGEPPRAATVDLRDAAAVRRAVRTAAPELILHLGAQALVRESYATPAATFDTNVMGLVHLLEAVRDTPSVRALVVVTSDKCYRVSGTNAAFREDDPLGGHDPYSASKACAELVTASWRDSFLAGRVAIASARAGNVIGGGDWAADRLVPDLVRAAATGRAVPIRSPQAVRPWQHVLEPLAGYLLLAARLLDGDDRASGAWNFGPTRDGHVTVQTLVAGMQHAWPAIRTTCDVEAHPHETAVLQLDCTRAQQQLEWTPIWDLATTLHRTAGWYRSVYEQGRLRSVDDLVAFVHDAARAGAPWTRSRHRDARAEELTRAAIPSSRSEAA